MFQSNVPIGIGHPMVNFRGAGDTSRSRSRGRIIAPRSGGDPVDIGGSDFLSQGCDFFLRNDELFETQNPLNHQGFIGVLASPRIV